MPSGAHEGLTCPLERGGVGGLRQAGPGICGSKYVEDEKAARSVGVWPSCITWRNSTDRRITRASSDAGPELAGREAIAAMESP